MSHICSKQTAGSANLQPQTQRSLRTCPLSMTMLCAASRCVCESACNSMCWASSMVSMLPPQSAHYPQAGLLRSRRLRSIAPALEHFQLCFWLRSHHVFSHIHRRASGSLTMMWLSCGRVLRVMRIHAWGCCGAQVRHPAPVCHMFTSLHELHIHRHAHISGIPSISCAFTLFDTTACKDTYAQLGTMLACRPA